MTTCGVRSGARGPSLVQPCQTANAVIGCKLFNALLLSEAFAARANFAFNRLCSLV
jgi:hypothetical protein